MRCRRLLPLLVLAALCSPALAQGPRVVLMTHDSFAVSSDVLDAFTSETGIEVVLLQAGDAGAALNRAALTRARPDAAYRVAPDDLATPVTAGFVGFNLDRAWFETTGTPLPTSLADLTDPRWANLTVVTDPATSSPGLSLLLGTIGAWGADAAFDWWADLRANGLAVRAGWSDAYYADFTRYGGDRPIVLSYASSPAAEVLFAEAPIDPEAPPTVHLRCARCSVRQVETAGVLRNAAHPDAARRLIDFLLQEPFQSDVPLSMFVYPVRAGVALPEVFERYAEVPTPEELLPLPETLDGATVDAWIDRWTEVVVDGR